MINALSGPSERALFARMRAERPLIHNITNHVVMAFTANALLAIGASPAMAHAPEEAAEFVGLAQALVINIGTLDATFLAGMEAAARTARDRPIPWVLDPVGVGATALRNRAAAHLAGLGPAVIRANPGETIALSGAAGARRSRGVDSLAGSDEALAAGESLARQTGAVIAITGATDYVVTPGETRAISGGHPLSQAVTGTGCTTTALVGAFLALAPPADAATTALRLMKDAAATAAAKAQGPGGFAVALIDALRALTVEA